MLINFYFSAKEGSMTINMTVIPLIYLFFGLLNFIIEDHSNLTGFFFQM